jgi:hypothetical protein
VGIYALLLALALISSGASGFGVDGHKIITKIAENHLTDTTKKAIAELTGGADLINLALWPDRIRYLPGYKKSAQWHYVNIAVDKSLDEIKHRPSGDILTAIRRFHGQLTENGVAKIKKAEALRFFIHFAQDLHQPLHIGLQADRGGNDVAVQWFNATKTKNLHWVWDTGIIATKKLTTDQYVQLLDQVSPQKIQEWNHSDFLDWAEESRALRQQVYNFSPEIQYRTVVIGQLYVDRNIAHLEKRLVMAGIRLAGRLNKIFDPSHLRLQF